MAGIDDLPGSGVYDDGKGKGGEGQGVSTGPSEISGGGSSGPSEISGGGEVQEVATQGFGWSFDPS